MFFWSNLIGTAFLLTEALLAYFAFSSLSNFCVEPEKWNEKKQGKFVQKFPCAVSGLYNENFLDLPGLGQICNFYPMLNIAAVPILNITLRNNLLDVVPVKVWIRKCNRCLCLLEDDKNSVKGLWSIILTVPVVAVVLFTRDVQDMVTYTGGFCGAFILIFIPTTLVYYARKVDAASPHGVNPNASSFKSMLWVYAAYAWGVIVLVAVILKIVKGGSGE
jgi:hypothetical protein